MTSAGAEPHTADAKNLLDAPAFVGRERELSEITAAFERPSGFVVIEGEAGIGKTRLLREALASPAAQQRQVMVATCPAVVEPFPLGPIVDALRCTCQDVRALPLSPLAGALRPLFPEWAEDLPPAPEPLDDRTMTRHRLLSALAELLDELGIEVMVLEDAHWADVSTLELLLMLTTRPGRQISLVLTYRSEDVPGESLLPRLTSRLPAGMTQYRVELAPLTSEQCGVVVSSMLGSDQVSPEFVAFLHTVTEGVPLALEETVRLLRERRHITRRNGKWIRRTVDELQVPATVRDSVLERVTRLDPEAQRMLHAAAVVGGPVDERLLSDVAGFGDEEARRGLGAALASRLLEEPAPGRLAFRHVLASRAVYEAIPASERRRLHHRAGRALEHMEPRPVTQLARHFREANDLDEWKTYGEAAAELALASGDDRSAVSMLLDLLSHMTHSVEQHGRLAHKLAEAAAAGISVLAELGDRVIATLRSALDRDELPTSQCGEIRYLLGRILLHQNDFRAGRAEIERSISDLDHNPELATQAMMVLSWPWMGELSADDHRTWLNRAARHMTRLTSAVDGIALTVDRAVALLELGENEGWDVAARCSPVADALAATDMPEADAVAARRELARGYCNVGVAALAWGRYAEAGEWFDGSMQLIGSVSYSRLREIDRINRAQLDFYTGAWSDLTARSAALAAFEDSHVRVEATALRGMLALAEGDTSRAEQTLRSVLERSPGIALDDQTLGASAALTRLQLAVGAADEAVQTSSAAIDKITTTGLWLFATDIAPAHIAALLDVGATQEAEEVIAQFESWFSGKDIPAPYAAVTTCRASLAAARGGAHRASEMFGRSAELWEELPRPYDELLARECQGRCLFDAGRPGDAVPVLESALRGLTELGARWDADRIARLLRQHGVDVVRTWRGGRRGYGDRLSPRERQVTRLVADGMTNREVGAALFLSTRTVDRHLSGAMRKLGVRSRTALAKVVANGEVEAATSG